MFPTKKSCRNRRERAPSGFRGRAPTPVPAGVRAIAPRPGPGAPRGPAEEAAPVEGWPCTPVPGNLLVQQDSCLGLRASPGLSCRGGRAALDFDKEASIGLPRAQHPCRTLQTPADGSAAVRAPLCPGAGGSWGCRHLGRLAGRPGLGPLRLSFKLWGRGRFFVLLVS